MKKSEWIALGLSALAAFFLPGGMALAQAAPQNSGVHFITDVMNVEDFAPIDGTNWVIGSSLSPVGPNPKGPLYVFNTKKTTASPIDPRHIAVRWNKMRYGACPSIPDMAKLVTHGLGIVPSKGKVRTLYVANHGGRESVETFSIDLQGEGPSWTWIGCVSMPAGTYADAVAALPDDGMVISSRWNPQDAERLAKLRAGAPVGSLFEWSPGTGLRELEETKALSGPNGVIASLDGEFVFVAVWSGKAVARIDRSGAKPKVDKVETGFLTDNLRWSPDGRRIYAGGQATSVDTVLACCTTVVNCPNVPFQIDGLDPKTLTLKLIIPATTLGEMDWELGPSRSAETTGYQQLVAIASPSFGQASNTKPPSFWRRRDRRCRCHLRRALRHSCSAVYAFSRFAHDGGLITYGVDLVEHVEQLRKAYSDTYVFLRKGG